MIGRWFVLHPWTFYIFSIFGMLSIDYIMLPFGFSDTVIRVDLSLRFGCALISYLAYVIGIGQLAARSWLCTAFAALIVTIHVMFITMVVAMSYGLHGKHFTDGLENRVLAIILVLMAVVPIIVHFLLRNRVEGWRPMMQSS